MIGIAAFSLIATKVYPLNASNSSNNNFVKETMEYNQNLPYCNAIENCPYYDESTCSYNCPNNESESCKYNKNCFGNGYGRHVSSSRRNCKVY